MSGVNKISASQSANATQGTSTIRQENGKVVLSFKGKNYELTKKQADEYNELLYNLNYTKNRIGELKAELGTKGVSAERKAEIKNELKTLQVKYAKQQQTATFDILPAQNGQMFVSFNLKKDINAEEFKKLFDIKEGGLRNSLKKEALQDGVGIEKVHEREIERPFATYDDAMLTAGGLPMEFSNGVILVASDDAGHYYPDYSGAELYGEHTYNVLGSDIDSPEPKPWWKFW